MRVKKQKRHRKVVRFYSACFGFREPFKVLCDARWFREPGGGNPPLIQGAVFDLPEDIAKELLTKQMHLGNTISKITKRALVG